MRNIDISKYRLVQTDYIKKKKETFVCTDIEVHNDHSFFITKNKILTHNCDGSHISSLLINFFYKWFPHIITENRLFILCTPIMSGEINGKLKYIYDISESHLLENARNIRYLKGLGSLNIKDWEKIMKELKVYQIKEDGRSDKILKIAFGESADSRKKWLSS